MYGLHGLAPPMACMAPSSSHDLHGLAPPMTARPSTSHDLHGVRPSSCGSEWL